MDKLQLVIEYTRNMLKAGHCPGDIDVSKLYNLVDNIEDQGVDRGIVLTPICNYCRDKVAFVDVSTLGHPDLLARCKCRKGQGKTKILALRDWRMQAEGSL